MSNMYDILKKLNAIEQSTASADKTKLQESAEAIAEVTPPGREKQVKALKKVPGIDNPWAVSWASYNKSKKKTDESEEALEEGFDELDKYMKGKQGPESKGGEGKKAGTRYGGSAQKDDAEDDDAEDQDKDEKSKGGRKVGSKSGARHSYKKIDEYISEAYGGFFEGDLEEDDMEEGNKFTGNLMKARAAGKKEADLDGDGDMEPVKEEEAVEEAKSCNHTMEGEECPVHGESKCPMEESASQELEEVRALAGLKECGDMSPITGGNDTGKMSISSNMDTDGHKTVTITADGDSAVALMQMLKLAGMSGDHVAQGPAADDGGETYDVATVSTDEEMGEDHIPGHLVGNGTEPQTMPVQALTKGGTGEVAGKEKQMHPGGYKFSDNPMAMENKLGGCFLKEYESIKLAKGK